MPTYDYRCKSCKHEFEKFQSITEDRIKICPECGGEVERLIGAGAGLIFKGSGFYITDYKNKKTSGEAVKNSKKTKTKKDNSGTGSKPKPKTA